MRAIFKILIFAVAAAIPSVSWAQTDSVGIDYEASLLLNSSTGRFAPYLIGSLNHGKIVRKNSALVDAKVVRSLDLNKRFSWSAGIETVGGVASDIRYEHFDNATSTWGVSEVGISPAWLQQLYAQMKWRGVFLTAGLKEHSSALLSNTLSSGDLVESGNARPIPEVRVGFVDFQNIPFTNGWAQIQGEISYGIFTDKKFNLSQFNHYDAHISTGLYYTYKRCYFRTKPSQPLHVTVGMQAAALFGGTTWFYYRGEQVRTVENPGKFKDFAKMFVPAVFDGDGYVPGSTLGSWDLKATYSFRSSGNCLSAYFQWPWEDGSSIGRRNRFDGLWGLQFDFAKNQSVVRSVVLEYIDFTDQSGPLHWAPSEYPGTTLTPQAQGADDYYNNSSFNAYANYGMAIGSPFLLSPIYNLDGFPQFKHNRARGVHLGLEGAVSSSLGYRVLASRQYAWGGNRVHQGHSLNNTSVLVGVDWRADALLPGLHVNGCIAFDAGKLRGDNFGAALSVSYCGSLDFSKK